MLEIILDEEEFGNVVLRSVKDHDLFLLQNEDKLEPLISKGQS